MRAFVHACDVRIFHSSFEWDYTIVSTVLLYCNIISNLSIDYHGIECFSEKIRV